MVRTRILQAGLLAQPRGLSPALVGDLIRATAPDISSFRFPSRDTGNVRGWDGHLVSEAGGLNVPDGESYWEIKTSKDAWGEGLSDFRKRSSKPSEEERAAATFIFVSSRTWDTFNTDRKIEDWVKLCRGEYAWKNVLCLDAIALDGWLDKCPAVAANFASYTLGLQPQRGARSTDEFWDEFRHMFKPLLIEEVLLCDREREVAQLIEALLRPNGSTAFISDSAEEVIAFGVAAIRTAKPEIRAFLDARTIIVDDMDAARALGDVDKFEPVARRSQEQHAEEGLGMSSSFALAIRSVSVHQATRRCSSLTSGFALPAALRRKRASAAFREARSSA